VAAAWLLAVPLAASRADCVVLRDVPNYYWYHGCSPTAGMMVLGYWDACGCPNLIPGANTPSGTVDNLIASPQHVSDYALYKGVDDSGYASPYPDKSSLGGAHASNCLADFMYTSESSAGNCYGETATDQIAAGMARYATWKGYSFTPNDIWVAQPQWSDFIKEIQFGRPVVLGVDSDGDGHLDHSATAIGYRTTNGYFEYLCRDTYGEEWEPRWARFTPIAFGTEYGVGSMATLRPVGTSDSTWKGASGASWNTSTNWQGNVVPTASTFVWLPSTAQVTATASSGARMLQLQGGLAIQSTMALGALRVLDGGSVTLTTGTPRLAVANAFVSDGLITQSTGTVTAAGGLVFGPGWTSPQAARYDISGGQLSVTGTLAMNPVDAGNPRFHLSGTGDVRATAMIDVEASRFEWYGGTVTTPKMHLGPNGRLVMGTSFSMNSLADGTLLHGGTIEGYHDDTENVDYGPEIEVTHSASATHTAYSFNLYSLTVGSSAGPGTYLASGSASLDAT